MNEGELRVNLGAFAIGIWTDSEKVYQRLRDFYRNFLTSEKPILTICAEILKGDAEVPTLPKVSPHRIAFDAESYSGEVDWQSKRALLTLAVKNPVLGVDYFLRVACILTAYHVGGLMVHAAGVEREGKAFLFLGYSGAGKTTTARNSPPGSVLNDDLLILHPVNGRWNAFSTPFYNPTQVVPRPGYAGLAKLLYLVKDTSVYLESIGQAQALAEMVACVPTLTVEPFYLKGILARCSEILNSTPYFHLHLKPDDSYWQLLIEEEKHLDN